MDIRESETSGEQMNIKKIKILRLQKKRLLFYLNCNKEYSRKKIKALQSEVKYLRDSLRDLQKNIINIERVQDENISD